MDFILPESDGLRIEYFGHWKKIEFFLYFIPECILSKSI